MGRISRLKSTLETAELALADVGAKPEPNNNPVSSQPIGGATRRNIGTLVTLLGQQWLYNLAMHVGQAKIAALESVGQLRVVQSEQVQNRGV